MYELRVLSGWHRGESLPLAGKPHLIGTGHDCDLMLNDAGIAARHAKLWPTAHGWLLTVEDGAIHAPGSSLPQCAVDLRAGDFVRVADVWMAISATEAAWEEPPPAGAHAAPQAEAISLTAPRRSERKNFLIQLAAAVVISAVAWVAVFKSPAALEGAAAQEAADDTAANAAGVPTAALSPEQLRQAFRSRLADAALMTRFKLTLDDRSWLMHAVLDDAEAPRFERVLWEFLREHKVSFPVSAKIVSADTTLPFKIEQIVSGANASVVMQDGRRVRVGEQYRGVRLLAIKGNRLIFGGKRKIELKW